MHKISTEWSANLAYCIGLIATDGSLSKDGRHIEFISKDRDLVETFCRCLGIRNRIGSKVSGYKKNSLAFRVQFGDVAFYRWLLGLGLTPNKSLTIGELKIPDEFFFDFLRGSFDGDGTIYSFRDERWKNSFMFYVRFVSASKKHLEWLQAAIHRLLAVRGIIRQNTRAYHIVFAKRSTRKILEKIYAVPDAPCLERKLAKCRKILTIDTQRA